MQLVPQRELFLTGCGNASDSLAGILTWASPFCIPTALPSYPGALTGFGYSLQTSCYLQLFYTLERLLLYMMELLHLNKWTEPGLTKSCGEMEGEY